MKTAQFHTDSENSRLWDRITQLEFNNNDAATRIMRLEADLLKCREFIDNYVDVVDGSYGEPSPNRAMALVSMIDETMNAISWNVPGNKGKNFPEKGKDFPVEAAAIRAVYRVLESHPRYALAQMNDHLANEIVTAVSDARSDRDTGGQP